MLSTIAGGNCNPVGTQTITPDGCSPDENIYAVGENIEEYDEIMKIDKIEHFVSKFIKEYGQIDRKNLTDATHVIANWTKMIPSEVKPNIERLCKIA